MYVHVCVPSEEVRQGWPLLTICLSLTWEIYVLYMYILSLRLRRSLMWVIINWSIIMSKVNLVRPPLVYPMHENINSLSWEWPSGLEDNQLPNVQDAHWSIPGLSGCPVWGDWECGCFVLCTFNTDDMYMYNVRCVYTCCCPSLQDQLATTSSSYEKQLSTMSDHLCELNDKLLRQTEELEFIKRNKACTCLQLVGPQLPCMGYTLGYHGIRGIHPRWLGTLSGGGMPNHCGGFPVSTVA